MSAEDEYLAGLRQFAATTGQVNCNWWHDDPLWADRECIKCQAAT